MQWPNLKTLTLDESFFARVRSCVSALDQGLPWREFGRIPVFASHHGRAILLKDLMEARLLAKYCHLSRSPAHGRLRERLGTLDPRAARLFAFLCVNEPVKRADLEALAGPVRVRDWIGSGSILEQGTELMFPLSLVPWADTYYFADSHEFERNRQQYGVSPVYVGDQTHIQLAAIRRRLGGRTLARALEMGCGTGIISLELEDLATERVGVDIDPRAVAIARGNAGLRGDAGVAFAQSDLFSSVEGRFDLIVFNPWQPSEAYLDLIVRFVSEAPEYLAPDGKVALSITSDCRRGHDTVMAAIRDAMGRAGMRGVRDVIYSRLVRTPTGRGVYGLSFMLMEQCSNRDAGDVRLAPSAATFAYFARRAGAGLT